jgi:mevalonate kinase
MTNKKYPAKLLLFGEYTVINKSKALAIPYRRQFGNWDFIKNKKDLEYAKTSNTNIRKIYNYLSDKKGPEIVAFDYKSMLIDLDNGLYFDSNIPNGYGMGSSGALCAAIYDRYFNNKTEDLSQLLKILAFIEGHFHGTSSGIDPFVSYINKAVILNADKTIELTTLKRDEITGPGAVFIIDTGIQRQTTGLVEHYLKLCEDSKFTEAFLNPVSDAVHNAICAIIDNNNELITAVEKISELQLSFMQRMIPKDFIALWENGLNTNDYLLKLCGAGGGGYLLGFVTDKSNIEKYFNGYSTTIIFEI